MCQWIAFVERPNCSSTTACTWVRSLTSASTVSGAAPAGSPASVASRVASPAEAAAGTSAALATNTLGFFAAFGLFLFVSQYMQLVLGLSPLETGLAFLPMNFAIIITATLVNTRILARTGPRPLVPTGMLLASLGMVLLTRIGVDTGYYWGHTLLGSMVSVFGGAAALVAFVWLATRK